jgi:hypothetical protein
MNGKKLLIFSIRYFNIVSFFSSAPFVKTVVVPVLPHSLRRKEIVILTGAPPTATPPPIPEGFSQTVSRGYWVSYNHHPQVDNVVVWITRKI